MLIIRFIKTWFVLYEAYGKGILKNDWYARVDATFLMTMSIYETGRIEQRDEF